MDISASIAGISYIPYLCSSLTTFDWADMGTHFPKSSFILRHDPQNTIAMSWWVSAKRTRSYPYARVYDTLGFSGKKITVLPIFKDEGKKGDRDFLQWDTISLMSLINVYVIIGYYVNAKENPKYPGQKITDQRFDMLYVKDKIKEILSHHSSALHWNLEQASGASLIGDRAIASYQAISSDLNVDMHSWDTAIARFKILQNGSHEFQRLSRSLAMSAQQREVETIQAKERISGNKGTITIQNYLGGLYYLTLDEVEISGADIHLIEAKHTRQHMLPSYGDIKDALIKMLLFSNLKEVKVDGRTYNPVPVLKLTSDVKFNEDKLSARQARFWKILKELEAKQNHFRVMIYSR